MAETTKPPSRLKNWLLIGSLATNLLIVGLVAGFVLRGPNNIGERGPQGDGLRDVFSAIPKSQQNLLRRDLQELRSQQSGSHKKLRTLPRRVIALLEEEDFDLTAFEAIVNEQKELMQKVTSSGVQLISKRVADMNFEERKQFAENLRKLSERRRNKPKRDGKPNSN